MKKILILFLACCVLEHSAQRIYEKARLFIDQDQFKQAAILIDSCFDRSYYPDSALYYKSILLLKDQKPDKALKIAGRLEHEYPGFQDVHYVLGMICFANNDYGKSIQHFNHSLEHDPQHVKALQNRALAEALLEDYEAAIADLSQAIAITPLKAEMYYSRAYWRNILGKTDDAISDFTKCTELDPKYYDAYLGLAQIYHHQKDITKACEVIERAITAGSQVATELKTQFCGDH